MGATGVTGTTTHTGAGLSPKEEAQVDSRLQSVLKLLSNFLNQVKQQQLPYNPSNPRMLRGARVAVEWGANNNASRQYICTVDNFDGSKGLHHVTYDDGDTRWYVTSVFLLSMWYSLCNFHNTCSYNVEC